MTDDLICTECLRSFSGDDHHEGDVHWKPGTGVWVGIPVTCGVLRPHESREIAQRLKPPEPKKTRKRKRR